MACQPTVTLSFETRTLATKKQVQATKRHVQRIEAAKALVCGVPSAEAITKLRHDFEALLPMLEEGYRTLNSGVLDHMSDAELRDLVHAMQERDAKMSMIFEGSLRIGLAAVEPFPQILERFKVLQERLQSQIEGIRLSLSDSFQVLAEKSAEEITLHA